jgi:hypothetical protein
MGMKDILYYNQNMEINHIEFQMLEQKDLQQLFQFRELDFLPED